jgi:hypothetical protein
MWRVVRLFNNITLRVTATVSRVKVSSCGSRKSPQPTWTLEERRQTSSRWEEGMPQGSTIGYAAWPSERNKSHEEQKG